MTEKTTIQKGLYLENSEGGIDLEYSLTPLTWFWLFVPTGLIILLSLINLLIKGSKQGR